ncbi:hypothetical protein BDZ91DRAFT_847309 [Kalaharituber pfeilii]|nr:hypothetical protein BDZ91DRAFT_847309 [Kalaharituber pfeilii]
MKLCTELTSLTELVHTHISNISGVQNDISHLVPLGRMMNNLQEDSSGVQKDISQLFLLTEKIDGLEKGISKLIPLSGHMKDLQAKVSGVRKDISQLFLLIEKMDWLEEGIAKLIPLSGQMEGLQADISTLKDQDNNIKSFFFQPHSDFQRDNATKFLHTVSTILWTFNDGFTMMHNVSPNEISSPAPDLIVVNLGPTNVVHIASQYPDALPLVRDDSRNETTCDALQNLTMMCILFLLFFVLLSNDY